jgi:hypothetical protein
MYLALIGIAFFLILSLIAIRLAWAKRDTEVPGEDELIHRSGLFSIVRKSPRETITTAKPGSEEVGQYLADTNVDIAGERLPEADKKRLREMWERDLEASLCVVEQGDREGVEFYYYTFDANDPVCAEFISKGFYVTREEIYRFPHVLPPHHLGCRCKIASYHGTPDELRETTQTGMRPFFIESECPPLPDWHTILKPA